MKTLNTLLNLFYLLFPSLLIAQPNTWTPIGLGGGGGLFQPSFSPTDSEEIFISCDMSEFFHSSDGGEHWNLIDFRENIAGPMCKIQFTNNPQVLYALDGSHDVRVPTKSMDGGVSWTPLANDPTNQDAYYLFTDITNQNRLLVSDYTHLYFSSTGGSSFSTAYTNANGVHIGGALFHGDSIYVGTNYGFLVSTNGGSSFAISPITGIPNGQVISSFCGASAGNTIRFYAITMNSGDVYPGIGGADFGGYAGVYTLDVGQNSWTNRTANIPAGYMPFFASMAVNDISTCCLSGSNQNNGYPMVLKTTNSGASWSSTFSGVNNQNIFTGWCGYQGDVNWGWAETALGFSVSPTNPNYAIITDYGFAHLTTDGGTNWKQVYVSSFDQNSMNQPTPKRHAYQSVGLENTSCWFIQWIDSQTILGSYTDIKGTRSTDGGVKWANMNPDTSGAYSVNTIYHTIYHASTNKFYAATSSIHDMYQSTYLTDSRIDNGTGQIFSTNDSGRTWSLIHNFNHPVIWLSTDPNNANRMYASVIHSTQGGIFVSNNIQNGAGSTWARVASNPPRTEGHPLNIYVLNDGTLVCTYSGRRAGSPQNFTQSAGVFVSTNGGTSWSDRSSSQMVYWTKDLTIDPHDLTQNTWFVSVCRGWGGAPNSLGGVFKTTNRGQNWTQVSDLLYAQSFTVSPSDSNEGYLTTEDSGLWYTNNLRNANPTFTAVTGYPFLHPQRVFFNPHHQNEIWVASFGNGIRMGSSVVDSLDAIQNLTIYSDGITNTLRWSVVVGANSYSIYGATNANFSDSQLLGTTVNTSFQQPVNNNRYFYRVVATN